MEATTQSSETTTIQPTVVLTEEQIQFFRENGYLSIPAITTPEEVEMMRAVYDRLFEQKAGRQDGNQFDLAGTDEDGKAAALPQMLFPSRYAEELVNTLARANAQAISNQLLGAETTMEFDHAILKPPGGGAPTPWHQDEAYWEPSLEYANVSVWIPLQPATIENGCMQFVPGSHNQEILPHQSINNDPRVHGLELAGEVDTSQAVSCELPAGGATFHGGRMLHATGANRSSEPRRAYIMSFGIPAQPRSTPRRFPWLEEKRTARQERVENANSNNN